MKNKIISFALVILTLLAAALPLAGCGNGEYPVEVANITINKKPRNIAVLDAQTADIVSYMGYLDIVAKSDDVDQEWLNVIPSAGSADNPDTNMIIESGADLVFAGDSLSSAARQTLAENDITVITMAHAGNVKQLETNYVTIGKIVGGNVTGLSNGVQSFNELLDAMELIEKEAKRARTTDVPDTVCYLYLEGGVLKMMSSGTYGDMLLSYTGAVNAAVNIEDNLVDVNTLKIANPSYIFYADDDTYNEIKNNAVLRTLSAVKTNKMLMVTANEMNRQGQTAIDTLQKMVYFIYPQLQSKDNNSTADETMATVPQGGAQSATQATTAAEGDTSVADDYKIKITSKLSLKPEDDNDNVKAMQQRLYDLGYVTDKENITGYYGEISEKAVKDFQKKNGIKETGKADNATLLAMFDKNAVKAK